MSYAKGQYTFHKERFNRIVCVIRVVTNTVAEACEDEVARGNQVVPISEENPPVHEQEENETIHNNKLKSNYMWHFFKVLLAAFIVSLSISSLSESSFFSPAPKEDPRVAELAQMVDVSGQECDAFDEKTIRIYLLNSVIDVQREKLDSQNKIIEQQNEMLIGSFIFISGVLFGAALLFVGLQRHAKTQDKNTPSLKSALIELSVSLLVMIPLVRLMSGWYDAYDDNKLGALLRLICILHLYFFAAICFGFSIFNIVSVLKEKLKTER